MGFYFGFLLFFFLVLSCFVFISNDFYVFGSKFLGELEVGFLNLAIFTDRPKLSMFYWILLHISCYHNRA